MKNVIGLSGEWAELIRDCRKLGPVWLQNQNHAASLRAINTIPSLTPPKHGNWAADSNRNLMLDYGQWSQVLAVTEIGLGEITVLTPKNTPSFAAQLISRNQRLILKNIIKEYHRPEDEALGPRPPCQALAPWTHEFRERARQLRKTLSATQPNAKTFHAIFERALNRNLNLRVAVINESAYLRYASLFTKIVCRKAVFRAQSEHATFTVDIAKLNSSWIVEAVCSCCQVAPWTLECYDQNDALCLIVQAPDEDSESGWRKIVSETLRSP